MAFDVADPASERPLLAALARQYTFSMAAPGDAHAAFEEGLALYPRQAVASRRTA